MKTQKILNGLAIALFAFVAITFASAAPITPPTIATPPPEELPIGSKAMLRAYAMEQVAGSDMSIWNQYIMWSSASVTNIYFHPEVAPTVDEALQALQSAYFSFKVTDKTKPLSVYAELHNSIGMNLFYGAVYDATVSDAGKIQCPKGIRLKMNQYLPIYVGENVSGASIRIENGNWDSLNVWNGYVFFNADYTEKDGMLILDYNDGNEYKQVGYSLRTGSRIPLFTVSGTVDTYIDDFYSFYADDSQPGTVYVNLGKSIVGDGHEAPVASINITSSTPRTVKFLCRIYNTKGILVEQPVYGWLFKKGSDTEQPISLLPGQWSGTTTLEAGQWFFYPETSLFETPAPVIIGEKG